MLAWGLKGTSRVIGFRCNCRRVKQSFPFSLYFIKYQDRMYVDHLITSLKCYDVNLHYLIKFGAMFSLRVVVSAWEGFVLHFGCACTCLFVYRIRGGFRFEGASGDVQCRLLLEVVLAVQIRLVEADPHWCWELLGTTSLVAFSNAWHFFLVGKIWSAYFWCLVWDVWFSAQVWQTVNIFFPLYMSFYAYMTRCIQKESCIVDVPCSLCQFFSTLENAGYMERQKLQRWPGRYQKQIFLCIFAFNTFESLREARRDRYLWISLKFLLFSVVWHSREYWRTALLCWAWPSCSRKYLMERKQLHVPAFSFSNLDIMWIFRPPIDQGIKLVL